MNSNQHIDGHSAFIPKNVLRDKKAELIMGLPGTVREWAKELIGKEDYRIFVVDQMRGRCYWQDRVITIPLHALQKGEKYKTWYLSHELAHAYDALTRGYSDHGEHFMEELKIICPIDCIHFELDYKPRAASAAGIRDMSRPEGGRRIVSTSNGIISNLHHSQFNFEGL